MGLDDFLPMSAARVRHYFEVLEQHLVHLEEQMAMTKAEMVEAFNAATNEIANDLTDLRTRLQQAVADKDQEVQSAVADALSGFEAPLQRLQALGANESDPVPDAPADDTTVTGPGEVDGTPIPTDDNPGPVTTDTTDTTDTATTDTGTTDTAATDGDNSGGTNA